MRVAGRSIREIDPQIVAALTTSATSALTGIVAWPTRAPITNLLKLLNVDYLQPLKFVSAWGTLMAAHALVISMADGVIALVADIKGRGNSVKVVRAADKRIRQATVLYWFILFSWVVAFILFGIGVVTRLYKL